MLLGFFSDFVAKKIYFDDNYNLVGPQFSVISLTKNFF